jgi:hypothetical protein
MSISQTHVQLGGVTVNTIVPTAIEGAGLWTKPEDRAVDSGNRNKFQHA